MEQTILSVSELNREVKQYLESTQTFKNVFIKGELSNITYYSSGHLYFTLKDAKASVKCAIFKYKFRGVPTDLKEGDQVKIRGNASLYETNGSFQIIADFLEKTNTIGSLYEKMEILKREYNEKGYFDESNKKKLPQIPMNIGVVTAETGAAIRDIINTTHKRFPNVNIYLYPSKVQGEGSAIEVSRGIEFFNRICDNGELDLDAAEILIPEKEKLVENLVVKKNRLSKSLLNKIVLMKKELEQREKNYYIKNYLNILNDKKIDMIEKEQKLTKEIKSRIEKSRENLKLKKARLSKFSVEDILKQGYTITRKDGKIVKRGIELSREDKVEIQFADSVRKAVMK